MKWNVTLEAEGDRVMTREEIVELADAVAAHGGIASGIGTTRYGAQLSVEADSREAGRVAAHLSVDIAPVHAPPYAGPLAADRNACAALARAVAQQLRQGAAARCALVIHRHGAQNPHQPTPR